MPELPDIAAYITALEPRILGHRLERVRIASPFLLRTAEPPIAADFQQALTARRPSLHFRGRGFRCGAHFREITSRIHKSEITLGGNAARNALSTASTSMTSWVMAPLTGLK